MVNSLTYYILLIFYFIYALQGGQRTAYLRREDRQWAVRLEIYRQFHRPMVRPC